MQLKTKDRETLANKVSALDDSQVAELLEYLEIMELLRPEPWQVRSLESGPVIYLAGNSRRARRVAPRSP